MRYNPDALLLGTKVKVVSNKGDELVGFLSDLDDKGLHGCKRASVVLSGKNLEERVLRFHFLDGDWVLISPDPCTRLNCFVWTVVYDIRPANEEVFEI
ncbi:MAG: hypothetical protein QG653_426 [Patescibacteria group bacterium]|nr:hypothetical protein [Patescibacteria group bacterium]